MANFKAVARGATNDDIIEAMTAYHDCMEARFNQVEERIDRDHKAHTALAQTDRHTARNESMKLDARLTLSERAIATNTDTIAKLVLGKVETNRKLDALIVNQDLTMTTLGIGGEHKSIATLKRPTPMAIGTFAVGALIALPLASKIVNAAWLAVTHVLLTAH